MITDPTQLQKMVDFAKIAKSQGFTPTQVDNALKDKGSSLNEVGAVMRFGADKVAELHQQTAERNKNRDSMFWGTVKHMADKDALEAGLKGAAIAAERALNGMTVGAYDWATEKAGWSAKDRANNLVRQVQEQSGMGLPMQIALAAADVGGSISPLLPATRMLGSVGNVATKLPNQFLGRVGQGFLGGAAIGGVRGAFDSDFDLNRTGRAALIGGGVGAAVPVAQEGWRYGTKFAKNVVSKAKNALDKITHNALSPSAEEMATGAQEISGALPDNGEMAGQAVKNIANDVTRTVKDKAKVLYDKAEELAANRPVVLDNNSNFAKTFNKLSENATKSGRAELNKVWEEVGHTKYDAPNYQTAKTFRSWLSEKSATGGTGLTKKAYGDLLEALDKDMAGALGKEATAAKQAADAFYRNEMANPDSITNSVNKLLRNDATSVVGNRAISSAQGKAWKASPLKKLIDEGEKVGSVHVADLKQALQANTTTRAQFNRMSPAQKVMVYGDKLRAAESNFNGGISNWAEKYINKGIDVVSTPMQKVLDALRPISTVSAVSAGKKYF